MEPLDREHPRRFRKNVPGRFYTLGERVLGVADASAPEAWCGSCMQCEAPEHEAPDLLAPLGDENHDTYFVRQPTSPEEVERACRAIEVCCLSALRYGGSERAIIERLGNNPDYCDYCIAADGTLWRTIRPSGKLSRRAAQLVRELHESFRRTPRPRWWQFWKRLRRQ